MFVNLVFAAFQTLGEESSDLRLQYAVVGAVFAEESRGNFGGQMRSSAQSRQEKTCRTHAQ